MADGIHAVVVIPVQKTQLHLREDKQAVWETLKFSVIRVSVHFLVKYMYKLYIISLTMMEFIAGKAETINPLTEY